MSRIPCKDGTFRYVYNDIDTAFPLELHNVKKKAKAAAKIAQTASAELAADHEEVIQALLFKIGNQNQSAQIFLRAAYFSYRGDPCNNDDAYKKMLDAVAERERIASQVEVVLIQLKAAIAADKGKGGADLRRITDEYLTRAIELLNIDTREPRVVSKMKEVRANSVEWKQP